MILVWSVLRLPTRLLAIIVSFFYIYVSQGSVATQLRCDGIINYCKLSTGCASLRMLKIGRYLAKIWAMTKRSNFMYDADDACKSAMVTQMRVSCQSIYFLFSPFQLLTWQLTLLEQNSSGNVKKKLSLYTQHRFLFYWIFCSFVRLYDILKYVGLMLTYCAVVRL